MTSCIAFQGEKGAFSEEAAFNYLGQDINPVPCQSFKDVFEAVKSESCQYGIIPIENSFTGSIHQNVDLLLDYELFIVGEIILRIRHNLLTLKPVESKEIKKIISHPQALQQCSNYLDTFDAEITPVYDTAGSAKIVAENQDPSIASVASERAAADYGLTIHKKGIENDHQNFTRFLIITRKPIQPKEAYKTSVVFSTKDIPGALFKALAVFAMRDINLLKIESRPLRKGPWQYWFYLDFEGHMEQEACQKAIDHLGELTDFIKVLGSYEKGQVVE